MKYLKTFKMLESSEISNQFELALHGQWSESSQPTLITKVSHELIYLLSKELIKFVEEIDGSFEVTSYYYDIIEHKMFVKIVVYGTWYCQMMIGVNENSNLFVLIESDSGMKEFENFNELKELADDSEVFVDMLCSSEDSEDKGDYKDVEGMDIDFKALITSEKYDIE